MQLKVVGRGGQMIIAWVSWRVFGDYVALSIITKPVTYSTFFQIFLQREPSLRSIYRISRDFSSGRVLHSKLAMWFMVMTMIFALAFSTMAGSMTGYTPAVEGFVKSDNGDLNRFSTSTNIAYVIHDGDRINLTADYMVSSSPNGELPKEPTYLKIMVMS